LTDLILTPVLLQTPVLFLVFNRPDTTEQVFAAIRKARPPRLYIASDGARADRSDEAEIVAEVREIATAVDWPCEVKTLFREDNLGCKHAVSEAISWFFKQEEKGIILEDDCLPHPDFFSFCDELLELYADDERVSVITGNNFQNGRLIGDASYYFSKYNHCWGWASWRRAWKHYDVRLQCWPEWSQAHEWREKTPDTVERRYWSKIFKLVRAEKIDTWDYQWTASVWYQGGLTATPNVNLVSNIGFGPNSTHTASTDSPLSRIATFPLGELQHPATVVQNIDADRYAFDFAFGGRFLRFPYSVLRLPRRVAGLVYRYLKRSLV
jgi:hypothetical protein